MNWDAIGAIGELLGVFVVVVSVIYLAFQVRQNTAATRAEALRSFRLEVADQFLTWGQDSRISGLWHKVLYDQARRADFPPDEMMSISFTVISRLSLLDAAYRNFREGILNEAELRLMLTSRIWELPFVRDSWPIHKQELSHDFTEFMELNIPQLREKLDQ